MLVTVDNDAHSEPENDEYKEYDYEKRRRVRDVTTKKEMTLENSLIVSLLGS